MATMTLPQHVSPPGTDFTGDSEAAFMSDKFSDAQSECHGSERSRDASRVDIAGMSAEEIQRVVHELQGHQLELEVKNNELREAQSALAEVHNRIADLYDFAPVGYVSLNPDGVIVEANLAAAQLLGVHRGDLVQTNINRFLKPGDEDEAWRHWQEVLDSDSRQAVEISMHAADGTPLVVRMESIAAGGQGNRQCRTALMDVTKVHRAQQVQESERRYRRLTEAVTDYIYRVRIEDGKAIETIHGANCVAVTGYTEQEFAESTLLWIAIVPAEDRPIVEQQVAQILSGVDAPPIEHRIRRKDGQIRWVLNIASVQHDEQGRLVGYDGLIRDITKRRKAEQALSDLNATLEQRVDEQTREVRLLAEAMASLGEGVVITSDGLNWPDPKIVYVNEALCRITGYDSDELVGRTPRMLQGKRTDPDALKELRRVLMEGRSHRCEVVNYRKDGTAYDAEIFVSPLFDAEGRHTNFIGIHRDITGRKRADATLRDRQERLRAILNTASDGIVIIDSMGIIDAVNPATETMFGYHRDEMIGQNVSMLMPSPYREEHNGYLERYRKTREPHIIGIGREVTGQRKDGSTFPIDLAVSEVDHMGLFTGAIRDLSERRNVEEELRREQKLTANIVNTVQNIVLLLDPQGNIIHFNPYTARLTGWSLEEVKGKSWFDIFLRTSDRPGIQTVFDRAVAGHSTRGNVNVILAKDDREREVEWYDAPLTDDAGNLIGLLCSGQDVTENRQLARHVLHAATEEQRRIGQDLHDSVGQEVAGLTMMADALTRAMKENSAWLTSHGIDVPGRADHVQIVEQLANGLHNALRQLKAVARGLHPVEVDPQGLHSSLHELAVHVSSVYGIACEFHGDDQLGIRDKDTATHLYRIAQEAATNAVTHGKAQHVIVSLQKSFDAISLEIRDDGAGLPADAESRGGMGLQSMRYRAELIGGRLTIAPATGTGTLVKCEIQDS